jgi:6,7-dimethyl-8-ribityllumazine synthase
MSKHFEGTTNASSLTFAVVGARFNEFIVKALVDGAVGLLKERGADQVDVAWVPGAVELPLVCHKLAASGRYDAVVAIGAVIRGGTAHFDYVAGMAANGIARASQETGVPVSFGVLTVDSIEQAIERAGTKMGNKGAEAALAAIETATLLRQLAKV